MRMMVEKSLLSYNSQSIEDKNCEIFFILNKFKWISDDKELIE